jgi:hypothetical protein
VLSTPPPPASAPPTVVSTPLPPQQQYGGITREDVIRVLTSHKYFLESSQIDYVTNWAMASGVRRDDLLDDILLGFVDGYYFPSVNRRKK